MKTIISKEWQLHQRGMFWCGDDFAAVCTFAIKIFLLR